MTIHRKIIAKRKNENRCTCGKVILHIQTIKSSETDPFNGSEGSKRRQKCGPLGKLISRSFVSARDQLVVPFSSGKAKINGGKVTSEDKCINCVRKTKRHEKQQQQQLLETISILQRMQIVKSGSSHRPALANLSPGELPQNSYERKSCPVEDSKRLLNPQFSSGSQKTPTRFTFESVPSSDSRNDVVMDPVPVNSAEILKDLAGSIQTDSVDILKDLANFSVLIAGSEKPGSASSFGTATTMVSHVSSDCGFSSAGSNKNQGTTACDMAILEAIELSVSDYHKTQTAKIPFKARQTNKTKAPKSFWFKFGSAKAS